MSSASTRKIVIQGPAGAIQARLELPAERPRFRAVVCHPHPLYAGTMDNKVVTTITRACRQAGGVALRFNFRGVGDSEGSHDNARGEVDDLLAAWDWLAGEYPDLPAWLAGFSFGSFVAAAGAPRLQTPPVHLLLVAPPVHHYDFEALPVPGCPVTVLQGDADEVVPPEDVHDWATASPWKPELVEFTDTGHFFHGKLNELKEEVLRSLDAL